MKNKKRIICIFSIVAVLGVLFWVLAAKGEKKLALNELQVNGEFQYAKAAWGISVEEAEKTASKILAALEKELGISLRA